MAYKQPSSGSFKLMGSSPAKQTSKDVKHDIQINKMMKKKGWNEGKKVSDYTPEELARIIDPKYQAKLSAAVEKEDPKEAAKEKSSPNKQLKGSGHGPATKFDKKRYPVGNPELTDKNPFEGKKGKTTTAVSDYYYKINGKSVNKAQYIKYENKPGEMEGGGKQTNNPDVYGRKKGGSPSNPK